MSIERRLAVGGMAELFVGRQVSPAGDARRVVVKCLLPGAGEELHALFRRERRVLAGITSPHIVALLGSGDEYLVLEHVDGPDLRALLAHYAKRGRPIPLAAARVVIEGLVRALCDLHAARGPSGEALHLVHRDVNPSNLLVSRDGAVKLADLGVVHIGVQAASTIAGVKGTLAYMAPEQLQGGSVDARTDLFAAGLVAYEVLTGVPARPAGMVGVAELLDVRLKKPAPPSQLRAELGAAVDEAVLQALEPSPQARPASAAAWLEMLERAWGPGPPDRAAAAEAVRPLLAARERQATAQASPSAWTPEPSAPAALSRPRPALVALLAVVGIGGLVWYGWPRPDTPTPAGPPRRDVSATNSPPSVPVPRLTPQDVAATAAPEVEIVGMPDVRPEVEVGGEVEVEATQAEVRRGPVASRPAPPPAATPARVVIERAGGGSLHVKGAGFQGLAPQSAALADGRHVVVLTGGGGRVKATLALAVGGQGVSAALGTAPGTYLEVECNGRARGPTPVKGLAVAPALRCVLRAENGAELGFRVALE